MFVCMLYENAQGSSRYDFRAPLNRGGRRVDSELTNTLAKLVLRANRVFEAGEVLWFTTTSSLSKCHRCRQPPPLRPLAIQNVQNGNETVAEAIVFGCNAHLHTTTAEAHSRVPNVLAMTDFQCRPSTIVKKANQTLTQYNESGPTETL